MNIKEAEVILEAIRLSFPNTFNYKETDMPKVVAIWTMMFEDEPYEEVNIALKSYISDSKTGFPPTIGQLKEYIVNNKASSFPTSEEAWSLVRKAIGNGIYGAKEEFDKLPPICQKLVVDPMQLYDWAMLDNEGLNVAKSVFLKRYPQVIADEKFQLALPKKVAEQRKAIADSQSKIKMLAEGVGK